MSDTGPNENQIQSAFFDWVRLQERKYPKLALCFAVPNGSHKSPAARGLFQRTGLRPGVPDVCLPVASGTYHGLWIEFKSKRGVLSDTQREWHQRLIEQGHRVAIVRDTETAIAVVKEHLGI